jgi:thiol-disulfide isomerase/thioredoxin
LGPEDLQQLLRATGENYRRAKSFVIEQEMLQTMKSELATMSMKYVLKVSVDGDRYRIESKDAWGSWDIAQSDGKTQWHWYPWRKQYSEDPAESSDPEGVSPGEASVSWLKQIDKKLASGRVQPPETIEVGHRSVNCMVVIGPPSPHQRPDPSMREYTTYWIDRARRILVKEQYLHQSTVAEHPFSSSRTTIYTVTDFNPEFVNSLFRFVPAAGMERVDKIGPIALVGKAAPSLRLKTLDGKDFDLSSLRGKSVLVDFWATWCMPCRESMPNLAKLYDEHKDKGLVLVSISKDDDPADAARFVAKYKYSWVNVADPKWESDKN